MAEIPRPDPHSFSRPDSVATTHLHLDIVCDFDAKKIQGTAQWDIQNLGSESLVLDAMDLDIQEVYIEDAQGNREKGTFFQPEKPDSVLGSYVRIPIRNDTRKVIVSYSTAAEALALQWLDAGMTQSGRYPCLFTQSQSIYARSWIPCQDGPAIRFSYTARVQVPSGMIALMSADNPQMRNDSCIYHFKMDKPVPAYLMALAAGDFDFKSIGDRTGVYADPGLLDKAAYEFADLEKMVLAAEALYGKYEWGRYDVIVLPTGFPFGGMENPKLTFLTPTVIAGDRSLTSLLAHELAHSWSGNLVTNTTWQDFWLNEGFTTYFESRIMESLYGKDYADMLSHLGWQDLKKTLEDMSSDPDLTKLKLDLRGKDPESALSDIAYEKGKLLLRFLEERLGRSRWDQFLSDYFRHFAFQSNSTEGFLDFLEKNAGPLPVTISDTVRKWIYEPGLIDFIPSYSTLLFDQVDLLRSDFIRSHKLDTHQTGKWSTHEWLHFLRALPTDQADWILPALDQTIRSRHSGNAEIAFVWIRYIINSDRYQGHEETVRSFLNSIGRRKFVLPLYESMATHGRKAEALTLFAEARKIYHPLTIHSIEKVLAE